MSKLKVAWKLLFGGAKGDTAAERLEDFYRPQAQEYDQTRSRMLKGRAELIQEIPAPEQGVWVELGSGTGSNLEHLGERIGQLAEVHLVDLTPSLMEVARARIEDQKWDNVQTHLADVTEFQPARAADVVIFSYSLTMIPDWFAAIDNAWAMLKPGGLIGVVDYYVSRAQPPASLTRHSWLCRTFVPNMFARNGVWPNADHLPYLRYKFDTVTCHERLVPLVTKSIGMPYYQYIGRKPAQDTGRA